MFPRNREVSELIFRELLGILVHAGIGTSAPASNAESLRNSPDGMTSINSTAEYSEGDLSKLIGYVKHLTSVGGNHGFSACIVGG